MTAELPKQEITELLRDWGNGDRHALEKLMPLVYQDLRQIAGMRMRQERGNHTLQPTALIHEAYLHLIKYQGMSWQNRAHFFAMASTEMRRILVDHARRRRSTKRGGGIDLILLDEVHALTEDNTIDVLALDEALEKLAQIDPMRSRIVVMRAFGSLGIEEMAEALSVSHDTIRRKWNSAKVWLLKELETYTHEESGA